MSVSAFIGLAILIALLVLAGVFLAWLAKGDAVDATLTNTHDDEGSVQQLNEQQLNEQQPDDQLNEQLDAQLIERVNSVLPQTQCAQCGYPGCRPYADAIIKQHELINRCPPGGDRTIAELANLLGTPVIPLNNDCGDEKPAQVAIINEEDCIGCTLCIHACPVDAIVGAGKLMHTVIGDECTGCELCLPPCPVDCIDLVTPATTIRNWQWPKPA